MDELDKPFHVMATRTLSDGGTMRFWSNGMVDAIDGELYSLSPGFNSPDEFDEWLTEAQERDAHDRRIREAGEAYSRVRDGVPREYGKSNGPDPEAVEVLEKVYSAHMSADGCTLDHIETAVLWSEIMRRSCEYYDLRAELGT